MERTTRRNFLKQSSLAAAAATLQRRGSRAFRGETLSRPRAPFKTLYSNDTTNVTSCVSPYHKKGEPFSDDRLRATIDEAKGVDVHMLQPGLGWIPWWRSDIYSAQNHYAYYQDKYSVKPDSYGRYLLAGGDIVRTFVDHCHEVGVAPFISYRLNDGHHVRDLEAALRRGRPSRNMSRFYWENYRKYRIGPDNTKDWSQGVFNWAIPAVRESKFAFIREICEKYDIAGIELDFLRYWSYFSLEDTTSGQRRAIMTAFVRRVRDTVDRTSRPGQYRWLCVRVPALLEAHDALGVDLQSFVRAGVDMANLSSSYFTNQSTDLPRIHEMIPETPLYLEMTHTTMTGRALSGSGTQPYRRTTDHQFYTTAHLAYTQGAAGVSLFNFVYYREHAMPELGPFNEPPFHVLGGLGDAQWLARQSQWYFLAAVRNNPPVDNRPLPVVIQPGQSHEFALQMAPTEHQVRDGLFRLMADDAIDHGVWKVSINRVELAPTAFIRKPIDHPYEGFLGEPNQYVCFSCPRSLARTGANTIKVSQSLGQRTRLVYWDLVLP